MSAYEIKHYSFIVLKTERYKLIMTCYTCEKMKNRFDRRDLPHTLRRQLQDLKQEREVILEEFTERTQEMATDGPRYSR